MVTPRRGCKEASTPKLWTRSGNMLRVVSAATKRWRLPRCAINLGSIALRRSRQPCSGRTRFGGMTTRTDNQRRLDRTALMTNEFQRVAIVNRGEAAMRFIHAAREFKSGARWRAAVHDRALHRSRPSCHVRPRGRYEAVARSARPKSSTPTPINPRAVTLTTGRLEASARDGTCGRSMGGLGLCGRARRIR